MDEIGQERRGKATVLAIGTELTTGQIINRNASWISAQLVDLGIEVVAHLTVPDEHTLILEALDRCRTMSQLIFITGGLGPTTDDFTREVVATWLRQPLDYHTEVWAEVHARLTRLGVTVAESNRQQCYFPRGAQILSNPQGTAAGFSCDLPSELIEDSPKIWVLPGPPLEINAIWEISHSLIESEIRRRVPGLVPTRLFTWQCIGKSEAELGEITENALRGSQLKTGYRAHRPFVEIKVWCKEENYSEKQPYLEKLVAAIAPWIFSTQGEDWAEHFLKNLSPKRKTVIIDGASGGLLAGRLCDPIRRWVKHQPSTLRLETHWEIDQPSPNNWLTHIETQLNRDHLNLVLAGFTSDGLVIAAAYVGEHRFQQTIQSPYKNKELMERTQLYCVEMALRFWGEHLASLKL